MIICSCNVLTDREVRTMVTTAVRLPTTTGQVYKCLGCRPKCGRCARSISLIMDEALGGQFARSAPVVRSMNRREVIGYGCPYDGDPRWRSAHATDGMVEPSATVDMHPR
jgi:bacterioferritin-associated ferredoxin